MKNGIWYQKVPRLLFKNIHIEPHPFLPFVYKKNFLGPKEIKASYKYIDQNLDATFPQLRSNNYRKFNGHDGSRDVVPEKSPNTLRIHCIGASTTGNYIRVKGENFFLIHSVWKKFLTKAIMEILKSIILGSEDGLLQNC